MWAGVRSAVLEVPSVELPEESNFLINPLRPDATGIRAVKLRRFEYDRRLRCPPPPHSHLLQALAKKRPACAGLVPTGTRAWPGSPSPSIKALARAGVGGGGERSASRYAGPGRRIIRTR